MITRKALIAALQKRNLDTLLLSGYKRRPTWPGYAAVEVLKPLIGIETFNQQTHVTRNGKQGKNPVWLQRLYTELAYGSGDICIGTVLYHL